MSLPIIVLLVIVLVVAFVLKKRGDDAEKAAAAKKVTANKSAKKGVAQKTSRTRLAQDEQPAAPPATTGIPDNTRQKIEQFIQNGNFQTAEVEINQLLKQDNSQHELYLYLLDLHIAQKDEIAIDQVIKHIHALRLNDIVESAEAKRRDYEKNKQPDAIEFNSPSQQRTSQSNVAAQDNSSEFDALVQPSTSQSFDDLQSELSTSAEEAKPVQTAPVVEPLDFNFSFEKTEPEAPSPAPVESAETKSQAPLEFSFNLEPTAPPAVEEAPEVEQPASDLSFKLAEPDVAPTQVEAKTTTDLDTITPNLDFNLETTAAPTIEPVVVEEKNELSFVEPETALEPQPTAPTSTQDINDPLIQSFPDLQQLDEAQLNLDLAEQYIELGAFESARTLLENNSLVLSADQQQRSEQLLNKIAS